MTHESTFHNIIFSFAEGGHCNEADEAQCVNWDHLQSWLKKRAVQMPERFAWHQPEGAVTLDWNP